MKKRDKFATKRAVVRICRWPASGEREESPGSQGTPLPKIEAAGDGRLRQKKTTASTYRGKGEKVV